MLLTGGSVQGERHVGGRGTAVSAEHEFCVGMEKAGGRADIRAFEAHASGRFIARECGQRRGVRRRVA